MERSLCKKITVPPLQDINEVISVNQEKMKVFEDSIERQIQHNVPYHTQQRRLRGGSKWMLQPDYSGKREDQNNSLKNVFK